MTRKLLLGMVILLLVTNLTTVAVWINDRAGGTNEDFSIEVDKKNPVATVGNQEIKYREWTNALESEYGKEILTTMINKEVVYQLAEEKNIEISNKLIERELSLLYTMHGVMSKDEIEKRKAEWTEEITYRLYLEALLTEAVEVPEILIDDYYEDNQNQYEFVESIQLSHVLVNDKATADRFISELEDGATFASLAREYSVDEDSRNAGGYLGFFTADSDYLPSGYYDKAMEMKEHSYSDPFLVGNEVAIIYLHRMLPDVSFTYDELKVQIKRELALEQIEANISASSLWEELSIEWIYE
ncbi:peptidylprolyl isomerase [Aquibacillus rhizosphaerae]|uniref:peptidylprolyl isomerase n=1 Tax=Aquibacillus rhizosphaerae TaxID=3051431 RepID=A0ABT7L7C8_9BACI|nr:peptidylprolyl isomerase [Aquibacillus sp. LR5S19]MDL4840505.1 peptidylprolyl isomerase [Aquibacillus sp. LR5S19]